MKPNRNVYSLDLRDGNFLFTEEAIKCPIRVLKPICVPYNSDILVTGGIDAD